MNELRSPFYLTHILGFNEIRSCGLGICLDLCHNRTIYNGALSGDKENLLHTSDKANLKGKSLSDDIKDFNRTDIVHLNDGTGYYDSEGKVFYEGIALGEGDIKNLPEIINHLNLNKIAFVIEVNEKEFEFRANTRRSIDYLLNTKGY